MPELTVTVALPLALSHVVPVELAEIFGPPVEFTTTIAVAAHPPLPVTVTVYPPAAKPLIAAVEAPVLQL